MYLSTSNASIIYADADVVTAELFFILHEIPLSCLFLFYLILEE